MSWTLVVALACSGGGGTGKDDRGETPDSGPADSGAEDSGAATSGDTGSPGTVTEPFTLSDVGWRLHATLETLAYVGWTQDGPGAVRIEYSVDPGIWLSTPERTRDAGQWEQILLGIPYATDVPFRIWAGGALAAEGTLQTGAAPDDLPVPTLELEDPALQYGAAPYLLTSVDEDTGGWTGSAFWTVILDRQGRTVWARRADDWTLFAQVSTSTRSHLLLDLDTTWTDFDGGDGSRVLRMTLDEELEETPTPGLQHAFVELPDGTLAWGSVYHAGQGEALVELAPGARDATVVWACESDADIPDDCSHNGLFYDPPTNSYLYSFWNHDTVVAVDRASGTLAWYAGRVDGGLDFVPPESQFELQHGVSYTAAGTLLLSTEVPGPTTHAREYEVDLATGALVEVWSFDAGVYALYNGDATRLPNGNTLHVVGNAGVIFEVTDDQQVAWKLDYHADRLLGHGEMLTDLYALVAE
ncbi:MAG: hypothetical protein ABMA64_07420 [Myxococcota bacterium]